MPPKKKTKTNEKRTLKDFLLILGSLSNLYEKKGDQGRAKSFAGAVKSLESFASLKKSDPELKDSKEYADIKGVGKSTLELMDEFIKTGKCARLDELEDKQVPLETVGREQLHYLVRTGMYEPKYRDAYEQLRKEENAFLEEAKTDLRKALDKFPYEKATYDDGFNLLVDGTICDFAGYKVLCQEIKEPDGECVHADVYYELNLLGKVCYVALHKYGYHEHWSNRDYETFHYTGFGEEGDSFTWSPYWGGDDDDDDEGDLDDPHHFVADVAKCIGRRLTGEEEDELSMLIDDLYEKHDLRRDEY